MTKVWRTGGGQPLSDWKTCLVFDMEWLSWGHCGMVEGARVTACNPGETI